MSAATTCRYEALPSNEKVSSDGGKSRRNIAVLVGPPLIKGANLLLALSGRSSAHLETLNQAASPEKSDLLGHLCLNGVEWVENRLSSVQLYTSKGTLDRVGECARCQCDTSA